VGSEGVVGSASRGASARRGHRRLFVQLLCAPPAPSAAATARLPPQQLLPPQHTSEQLPVLAPIRGLAGGGGAVCVEIPDGQSALMLAPPCGGGGGGSGGASAVEAKPSGRFSGRFSAVAFASFGNPTGRCGAYAAGTCGSAGTAAAVRAACVGRRWCVLTATETAMARGELRCPEGVRLTGAGGGTGAGAGGVLRVQLESNCPEDEA
jgi:hypothetical protein